MLPFFETETQLSYSRVDVACSFELLPMPQCPSLPFVMFPMLGSGLDCSVEFFLVKDGYIFIFNFRVVILGHWMVFKHSKNYVFFVLDVSISSNAFMCHFFPVLLNTYLNLEGKFLSVKFLFVSYSLQYEHLFKNAINPCIKYSKFLI